MMCKLIVPITQKRARNLPPNLRSTLFQNRLLGFRGTGRWWQHACVDFTSWSLPETLTETNTDFKNVILQRKRLEGSIVGRMSRW